MDFFFVRLSSRLLGMKALRGFHSSQYINKSHLGDLGVKQELWIADPRQLGFKICVN
jgi:hypothetical protein